MFRYCPVNSIDSDKEAIIENFNKRFLHKKNRVVHLKCFCCDFDDYSIIFNNNKYEIFQKPGIYLNCSFILLNPGICMKTLDYCK